MSMPLGLLLLKDASVFSNTSHIGERGDLVLRASDYGGRGRGFDPHMGRRVVSLSKTQFIPQKYWQEAAAPFRHD